MNKLITLSFLSLTLVFTSCKEKSVETQESAETEEQTSAAEQPAEATNQPKEYKIAVSPDTAMLGKKKEAFIKINSVTAIALENPDGKDGGMEITVNLTLTNRNKIGEGYGIHVDYPNSRLQLDNGTSIVSETGTDYLRAEPESTSKEESWTYKLPGGARPKALTLFMDDTRATVNLTVE